MSFAAHHETLSEIHLLRNRYFIFCMDSHILLLYSSAGKSSQIRLPHGNRCLQNGFKDDTKHILILRQ